MAQKRINHSIYDFPIGTTANENLVQISLPFNPNGDPCWLKKKASTQLHLKECKGMYGVLQKETKRQAALFTQVFIFTIVAVRRIGLRKREHSNPRDISKFSVAAVIFMKLTAN